MEHPSRPWYWKDLERCNKCFGYAVMQKHRSLDGKVDMRLRCFKCGNTAEWGQNEGVALCNWNLKQRELKRGEPDG